MLINAGLGTDPDLKKDWPVYAIGEPDLPDNVITVYDTAGMDDGRLMTNGELQCHYGWQMRVRAVNHPVGYRKINALRVYISETFRALNLTIEGSLYQVPAFTHLGEIMILGPDTPGSKRKLFTLNGTIPLKQLN